MNLLGEDISNDAGYRVLARKYRPSSFESLIGQDVLVRTLSNAIKTGRLAHAFLLTGIRGVGKTTTARIIARALNCIGEDGNGVATITPCGVCVNCKMIAEDRHMDVIEMDAASRTGVGDIRDLIETVHYAPTNARFKIYIIDEVHMLSNSAFNALLKTLEEPPPHVKFIFATTELRKIPVTILSRCQKFDLKRVDSDELAAHLARICEKEAVTADADALKLIANAAEGSVRDALSLLDQAIAHGTDESGTTQVELNLVRGMLGMADRSRSFELLAHLLSGETTHALHGFKAQYDDGADPLYVLQELMELIHLTTRIKLVPDLAQSPEIAQQERDAAQKIAADMGIAHLTRAWQILSKGLQEARLAPNPYMAAEMVLVRLMHASNLPTPAELIRTLQDDTLPNATVSASGHGAAGNVSSSADAKGTALKAPASPQGVTAYGGNGGAQAALQTTPEMQSDFVAEAIEDPQNFKDLVALFNAHRELVLWTHLHHNCELVQFEKGRLELNTSQNVPNDFAGRVGKCLSDWTNTRWIVAISAQSGQPSLHAQAEAEKQAELDKARTHPLVQTLLNNFAGAKVIDFAKPEPVHIETEISDPDDFEPLEE
ncbi:MAG: DNA polymerase III subunit gamma/tau [Alphaproteobacteria bacterium]|nr:DNA polymerase III subunit gamma/tau [Alphaproteobacteria bacterium]